MSEIAFSVGVPNYNHACFLRTALDAILNQSLQPDEIIVIDDASTDNSVEILREYARRCPHLRVLVNERNRGCAANLQTLLGLARGRYYYAAAADDVLLPGFFQQTLAILKRYPDAGLCSTFSLLIDEKGMEIGRIDKKPFSAIKTGHFVPAARAREALFKRGSWMQGNTVIFRRDALVSAGGYRSELLAYADGFAHEVIALRHGVCFVPQYLAAYRQMPTTFSYQSSASPAVVAEIKNNVIRLMKTEFIMIFTTRYIQRWNNRWEVVCFQMICRTKFEDMQHALTQLFSYATSGQCATHCLVSWILRLSLAVTLALSTLRRWFDLPRVIGSRLLGPWRRRLGW